MVKEIDSDLMLKAADPELADDEEDASKELSIYHHNHPLKRTAGFWRDYEHDVEPWHFATVKSHFTGKEEEFQDFRNPDRVEVSGKEAPFLKDHATAVQNKILDDKDIPKKMIGGKPHIWLWRGVSGKYAQNVRRAAGYKEETHSISDKKLRVPVTPLSSWSTKLNSAKSFASRNITGHPRVGAIMGAYVPVEDVLHSGFHDVHPGQKHEHEDENEIVIGHKKPHMAVDTKNILMVNHNSLDQPPAIYGEKDEDYVERMLSSPSEFHHKAVFNNPELSKHVKSKHLEEMLGSLSHNVRDLALMHPNLPHEHVDKILDQKGDVSNFVNNVGALALNPSLTHKHLEKISDFVSAGKISNPYDILQRVFQHPNTSEKLISDTIDRAPSADVNRAFESLLGRSGHGNITSAILEKLYKKNDARWLRSTAFYAHPNLPRHIMNEAALDPQNHQFLATNPNLGKEHIDRIVKENRGNNQVQMPLRHLIDNHADKFSEQNISDTLGLSGADARKFLNNPNFSSKHVDQILNGPYAKQRGALKDYPGLSPEHLHKLIKKQWVPEISKHPNFTSDHVTTALKSDDPTMRLEAIASPKATNAHVVLALKDTDYRVRAEAQGKAKGMIESFGNRKRDIEAALKRKQTDFFAKTEPLAKMLKWKENLAKGTSDWESQMREHEKNFRAAAHTGDWPAAIEHAKRLPKSWDIFQQMPSMGIPEEHAHKIISHLERPENEELRSSFAFEMAHNMPETASHKLLSRTANLSPDDYSVAGAVQKHPNWKPEGEEKGAFDVAKFFTDYEKHVAGHHFATIKSYYSGKTEEVKDHRGNVASSKEYEHLIPHIKAHAEKVQSELMKDPFTQKRWINGEAHVKLYRGVGGEYADKIRAAAKHNPEDNSVASKKLTIPVASLSSWSTKKETASRFAHVRNDVTGETKKNGVVLERWVPLRNVLHSGFISAVPGQEHPHSDEEEVVVGHPEEKISIHSGKLHFQLPSHEYGQTEQAEVRDTKPKAVK